MTRKFPTAAGTKAMAVTTQATGSSSSSSSFFFEILVTRFFHCTIHMIRSRTL